MRALRGVGDARFGEWVEHGIRAVHVRRRLSLVEQMATGLVIRDVRGTAEAERLLDAVRTWLPVGYREE